MTSDLAKRIVAGWLEEQALPPLVERDIPPIDLPSLSEILAIVGPRRAGKTYLMFILMRQLLDKRICAKDDMLFVDFEDYRLAACSGDVVDHLLTAAVQLTGKTPAYLFFDEIQRLPHWSRVVRTLHNQKRFRMVVSGSNSDLLSRDIATELRGRCRDLLVLPFSLREALRLRDVTWTEATLHTSQRGAILKVFDDLLAMGGFPELLRKQNAFERREVLQSYYRTMFYKDIVERYNIKAKSVLESMMRYCLNIAGDTFSVSAFEKTLKAGGMAGSKRTIANYLQYLAEAFFLVSAEKFSYSARTRMMNPKKVYLLDVGFSSLATEFSENRGKRLENIVAVELFRRRCEFFYFRGRGECDFVIREDQHMAAAIQVCWELNDRTRDRELAGLAEAMAACGISRGLLLTYDQADRVKFHGHAIDVVPVWRWLLSPPQGHSGTAVEPPMETSHAGEEGPH